MSIVVGIVIVALALGVRPSRLVGRGVRLSQISQVQRALKLALIAVELGAALAGVLVAAGVSTRGAVIAGFAVVACMLALHVAITAYVGTTRVLRPRRYQFVRAFRHAVVIHGFQAAPGMEPVVGRVLWTEWKDRTDGVPAAESSEARWDAVAATAAGPPPPAADSNP